MITVEESDGQIMFLCPELIETILSLQKTLHGIVLACYKSRNQLVRLSLLVGTVLEKKRDCQNYKEYQDMDTRIVFVNPLKYFSLLKNSSCLKHTCIHVLSLKGGRMELQQPIFLLKNGFKI